jgi:DNA-directed RNA polymerase subunit RPC12/RpoP
MFGHLLGIREIPKVDVSAKVRSSPPPQQSTECKYSLARNHALSSYTPICRDCGLILCELNMPYFACPHCSSQILTQSVRLSILARLEAQISERLAKEERDREQAIEDAKKAAGAFPTLAAGVTLTSNNSGPVGGGKFTPRPINQTTRNQSHQVLTIDSQKKTATLASYTKSPAPPSRPLSRSKNEEPEPVRVSKPAAEVAFVGKLDNTRPWADLKRGAKGVKYIASPTSEHKDNEEVGDCTEGRRRTRRNRQGKGRGQAKVVDHGDNVCSRCNLNRSIY